MNKKYYDGYEDEYVKIKCRSEDLIYPSGGMTYRYTCICKECGAEFDATVKSISSKHARLCKNCNQIFNRKNRRISKYCGTRIYSIWNSMKNRCYNKNHIHYNNYGGRGITVCDEWKNDPNAFGDWAIQNGYSDKLTLDRIDVNGNYCPNNCKWSTRKEQASNRRKVENSNRGAAEKLFEIDGVSKTLKEWSLEYGISIKRIRKRIYELKWDVKRAITEPLGKRGSKSA